MRTEIKWMILVFSTSIIFRLMVIGVFLLFKFKEFYYVRMATQLRRIKNDIEN